MQIAGTLAHAHGNTYSDTQWQNDQIYNRIYISTTYTIMLIDNFDTASSRHVCRAITQKFVFHQPHLWRTNSCCHSNLLYTNYLHDTAVSYLQVKTSNQRKFLHCQLLCWFLVTMATATFDFRWTTQVFRSSESATKEPHVTANVNLYGTWMKFYVLVQ